MLAVGSLAAVAIFESHDVVLAKVTARLNFDDMERDAAWIFDPMSRHR